MEQCGFAINFEGKDVEGGGSGLAYLVGVLLADIKRSLCCSLSRAHHHTVYGNGWHYMGMHRTVKRLYTQNLGLQQYGYGYKWPSYSTLWEYGQNIYLRQWVCRPTMCTIQNIS